MKTTITVPPPIQPPKVITLELTEVEAHLLSTMLRASGRGYRLEYDPYGYGAFGELGPKFTHDELRAFMYSMMEFQARFRAIPGLRFD